MRTATEILRAVNDFMARLPYEREPRSLYEPVIYTLSAGGKRIRPVLMLMSYNLFRDNPEDILWPASGLETYHNYTLLHDDLMDKADVRRGRATVHKKWNDNAAILSGDSMLVLAYERMARCSDDKLREVLDCFTETALQIGEGQQYDMDFESRTDVSEAEYMEMIRLKTSVLLACAVKIGAILADAPQHDQQWLYRFGENLGLVFQLQDDYLDVYGDPKVFRKTIGGDICNNKKTFMLINACRRAEGKDAAELEHWLSLKDFDRQEKIAAVTSIYNKMGIDRLALGRIGTYFAEAEKCLDAVGVSEERKVELRRYAGEMLHRDK